MDKNENKHTLRCTKGDDEILDTGFMMGGVMKAVFVVIWVALCTTISTFL